MLFPALLTAATLTGLASAACSAETRLAGAKQVVYSYNLSGLGQSAAGFKEVPFGAPGAGGGCVTTLIADGTCPIPVATTGSGTYDFAVETRQVFSDVTGEYIDFADNGTTLINTNVTLGVRDIVGIPITFAGHVYIDHNDDCRIYQVRAYAEVPISVLGLAFSTAGVPPLPKPVCDSLPVKRGDEKEVEEPFRAIEYEV
ncbi:uncharacterized protein LTR77_006268 [Saxophila tyrrhenica]|uniref:Uncharacterized protein n=1 Tax=Saxophila tyrrhenica TaxID=1690608 RepID=A0AAV9P7F7_9PEZI|nr:hypothetical protein LTR77_006268 [Saxophila tyrrhenica]